MRAARRAEGTVAIDFHVEQEDSVYPIVPSGAALDAMIRRPSHEVLIPAWTQRRAEHVGASQPTTSDVNRTSLGQPQEPFSVVAQDIARFGQHSRNRGTIEQLLTKFLLVFADWSAERPGKRTLTLVTSG